MAFINYSTNEQYTASGASDNKFVPVGSGSSGPFLSGSLLTGLVAYWNLDESSGTRTDRTGRGNDLGEVNGPVSSTTGLCDNAVDFEAANDERLSASGALNDLSFSSQDMTISMWVYPKDSSDDDFVSKWDHSGRLEFLVARVGSAPLFRAGKVSGGFGTLSSINTLTNNAWNFIVVTHTTSTKEISIRVNGNSPETKVLASTGIKAGTGVDFLLGGSFVGVGQGSPANSMDGRMDNVGVWERVLTPAERSTLYNSGVGLAHA